jgi:hypothetical protein
MDAWAMICQDRGPTSLYQWLLNAGVTQQVIGQAFQDWGALGLLDIRDLRYLTTFVRAAQEISQTRWNLLYNTPKSTVLFLNEPLLKELSYASSQHPNEDLDFYPSETIPLAVTIFQNGQTPQVLMNAAGARVTIDGNGNCFHLSYPIQGTQYMAAPSSEAARRANRSAALAEQIFQYAGEQAAIRRVYPFFGITPPAVPAPGGVAALAGGTPSKDDLNAMLNGVGTAPGSTTVVTVPAAPASGDVSLIQNVQTLDSYIATLAALVMYNNHPAPYDLSDKQQAAQFVIDLANSRNFVVTGGTVKAIPMYLPMGEATTQSFNKTTTSADLHIDLLAALFGALNLPSGVLTELDGVLTEIADSLKSLQLSFTTQTQRLNHFVSFFYLTPIPGTNPPINQMNVELIYLQLAQSSWQASVNKSSVSHFTLDMTTTRTTATMSAGIVAANSGNIVSSLLALTGNDATTIAEMTKMKGVKT